MDAKKELHKEVIYWKRQYAELKAKFKDTAFAKEERRYKAEIRKLETELAMALKTINKLMAKTDAEG